MKFYHKDSESAYERRLRSKFLKHIIWSKDKDMVWLGSPYESCVTGCGISLLLFLFYGREDFANLYERINGVVKRLTLFDKYYDTNL